MNSGDFYSSLRSMKNLLSEPALTDQGPSEETHNTGAKLLRHGLCISAFALLEKHLSQLFDDFMNVGAASQFSYADMPEKLKKFFTVDAVTGLVNKLDFLDKQDRRQFVETHLQRISSFASEPAVYTAFGFSPKGSNVGHEDIKQAFKALGASDPWGKLTAVTAGIGAARLDLCSDYKNLALSRHASAHNPTSNVPTNDLRTHIETATLVGVACSALLNEIAAAFAQSQNADALEQAIESLEFRFRFLDEQNNGSWLERISNNGNGIKSYDNSAAAITGAKQRQNPRTIVLRNVSGIPIGTA